MIGSGDADNGSFTIAGDQLQTAASFDFESKSSYAIRVRSMDQGGLWTEEAFTISVTDVSEVSLAHTTTTLPEDANTTSRIKVADIVVTDDTLGTNTLSLSGADSSLFEVEPVSGAGAFAAGLYLKAGTALDFETNPVLDVTVEVDDATVGGTPDDTADMTISMVPVLEGTAEDDVFQFVAGPPGSWTVNLNGVLHYFGPEAKGLKFNGLGGQDTAMITGTDSDDTVELWPGHGRLTGDAYSLAISNVETVTAVVGGGTDVALVHDNPEAKDTLTGGPDSATLSGNGHSNQVSDFRYVHVYGTPGGGDEALLQGDPNGQDTFKAWPGEAKLYGDEFFLRAKSFRDVRADGTPGGDDLALLHDDPLGINTFVGGPNRAELSGDAFFTQANSFRWVHAYSTEGDDVATLYGSDDRDVFVGTDRFGKLRGTSFYNRAVSFEKIHVYGGSGRDVAVLHDAVLETGVTQPLDMTQVAWLYEFERIRQRSDGDETLIDVVDQILTDYWE